MKKIFIASGLALALSLGAMEFDIDPTHSSVGFKLKHLMVSNVGGSFKNFSGKVDFDPKSRRFEAFEGQVEISSIDTDNTKRDDHLRSPDFFDVPKYPKANFKMTRQEGNKLYGILSLGSVSKEIVFLFEASDMVVHPKTKKQLLALDLETEINRKDFGIGSSTPDAVVSDKVKISINLELYKR